MASILVQSGLLSYKIGFSSAFNTFSNVSRELRRFSFSNERIKERFIKGYYECESLIREIHEDGSIFINIAGYEDKLIVNSSQ